MLNSDGWWNSLFIYFCYCRELFLELGRLSMDFCGCFSVCGCVGVCVRVSNILFSSVQFLHKGISVWWSPEVVVRSRRKRFLWKFSRNMDIQKINHRTRICVKLPNSTLLIWLEKIDGTDKAHDVILLWLRMLTHKSKDQNNVIFQSFPIHYEFVACRMISVAVGDVRHNSWYG